jgi:hypothetical protein
MLQRQVTERPSFALQQIQDVARWEWHVTTGKLDQGQLGIVHDGSKDAAGLVLTAFVGILVAGRDSNTRNPSCLAQILDYMVQFALSVVALGRHIEPQRRDVLALGQVLGK